MNVKIANRLLEYRLAHGLSQEALAEKLGVSRQAVSKWERAEASPDTDNLIALAALYGVLIDELINGEGKPQVKCDEEQTGEASENAADENDSEGDNDPTHNFSDIGINIDDGKDKVHIGLRGIHIVEKGGDEVHIDTNGVCITENSEQEEKPDSPKIKGNFELDLNWMTGVTPILCTIAYLILGFTTPNGWAWGWILFFLVPIVPSLVSAIRHRRPSNFAYPVFVSALYLVAGMCFDRWHPEWIIFLTIPVYYTITGSIEKHLKRKKATDDEQ